MKSGAWKSRSTLLMSAALVAGALELPTAGAGEVTASIHVPPAEVYVLGDEIPLVWRFTNRSSDPLAMLWEGCCRLNGKLAITANGRPVDVLPPGASSFHTYSKAETLPPGQPMEFSSRLADWVRLPAGGELEISGRYTGVLTNQNPQVASGLALWTGTAAATPTRLEVIGVEDYLDQRPERSRARGIELELAGPAQLAPLAPAIFTLTLRNPGNTPRTIDWPGTFQLWLVDDRGWRLEKGAKHLQLVGERLTVPPRGELARQFALSASDLNGEPFGTLQVFLDLGAATPEEKRVPSNAVTVTWDLSKADTAMLINEAAGGPATGLRNPALKLLRLYLDALQPVLESLTPTDLETDRARTLRSELQLAGYVQPLSPKAGMAFIPMAPGAGGNWSVALPDESRNVLDGLDGATQLARIADIRRHLGWDLTPEIKPKPETPVGEVFALAGSLAAHRAQFSGPVTWRQPQTGGGVTNLVEFPLGFPSANVLLKLTSADGRTRLSASRKPPAPGRPSWMNVLTAADVRELPQTDLPDMEALQKWLLGAPASLQPLVIADESLTCSELLSWLQPVVDASVRISVIAPAAVP